MTEKIKEQILAVRATGRTNMFDTNMVQVIADEMKFYELGSAMNWSALEQQIVDEVQIYIAPKIFGGSAKSPVSGQGVAFPNDAIMLKPYAFSQVGNDYFIESEVIYPCLQE